LEEARQNEVSEIANPILTRRIGGPTIVGAIVTSARASLKVVVSIHVCVWCARMKLVLRR
jgi:hypothetical protein